MATSSAPVDPGSQPTDTAGPNPVPVPPEPDSEIPFEKLGLGPRSPSSHIETEAASTPINKSQRPNSPPSSIHDNTEDELDNLPKDDVSIRSTNSDDGENGVLPREEDEDERRLMDNATHLRTIATWFNSIHEYDESNPTIPDADTATAYQILDTQMIKGDKMHQKPDELAKYYGFQSGEAFDQFVLTNKKVKKATEPLIKYLDGARSKTKGKLPTITFTEARFAAATMEGKTKRDLSLNRAKSMPHWKDKEYHAAALWDLNTHLFEMPDGHFHQSPWNQEIAYDRMWFIIKRIKRKHEKEREYAKNRNRKSKQIASVMDKIANKSPSELARVTKKLQEKVHQQASKTQRDLEKAMKRQERIEAAAAKAAMNPKGKKAKGANRDPDSMDIDESEGEDEEIENSDDMLEEAKEQVAYLEAQQKIERAQMDAISNDKVQLALQMLTNSSSGVADQDTIDAQNAAVDNLKTMFAQPGLFDEDSFEHQLFQETLDVHLPDVRNRHTFNKRLTEDAANKAFTLIVAECCKYEKVGDRSAPNFKKHYDAAHPHPGLLEAMKVTMRVLYPKACSAMVDKGDWGEGLSMDNSSAVDFDIQAAAEKDAQTVALQGDLIKTGLTAVDRASSGALRKARHSETDTVSRLLTNTRWENSDFLKACQRFNVNPGAPIRLPGMRPGGTHLFWFQVCALLGMLEKLEEGIVDGVILAAVVGLGKTITMLAYILWVSSSSA
jgi:hypothetical protein